ncbi:ABC transporter ATP-binding protein [Streptomyces sp. NPDC006784]|uniref:ABC transporter ATP-binding protein n=1 Tax=Streptomyces sp. NPDC006784 TaxID=3364764 RepID=UPI0036930A75
MTVLQARSVVKSYGPTPALRGAGLELAEGEVLAVTGPSGCGKSTLLHCLSGILQPDSGEVRYRGRPLNAYSEADRTRLRRTEFGVLFQFGQLVAEISAAENVALPLLLTGRSRAEARTAALGQLDRLGVADAAEARPGQLSGGQQQRVAAARALVTEPRVLFADEPTGALDQLAGEKLLGELVRTARERGTSVLLVTHAPVVAAYADREVVLHDGVVDPSGLGTGRLGTGAGTGTSL